MTDPTLRVGIMGTASIARKIIRAIKKTDKAQVVAIASRTEERARAYAGEVGLPSVRLHGSYASLLEDAEVDAVYIPLPTTLHVEWAVRAAAAGKHIVLEKPIAHTREDLATILSAATRAGVVLVDGTMWSHHPRERRMRELLEGPDVGPLTEVHSVFTFAAPAEFLAADIRTRADGDPLGALGDLGWYCVRASLWAADWALPASVAAHPGWVRTSEGVPIANVGATLVFGQGANGRSVTATVRASFASSLTQSLHILGEKGSLALDDFVVPRSEHRAAIVHECRAGLGADHVDVVSRRETHVVESPANQETLLWERVAAEVAAAGRGEGDAELRARWVEQADKTQRVLFAIMESAADGGAQVPVR